MKRVYLYIKETNKKKPNMQDLLCSLGYKSHTAYLGFSSENQ